MNRGATIAETDSLSGNLVRRCVHFHPSSPFAVLVLGPDGDDPGDRAAVKAAKRFVQEERKARIARPPRGMDWNDVLRQPEKEMADV